MKEKYSPITELLFRLHGIDVSKYDDSYLDKSLQKRITETHCNSAEAYINLLEQNREEALKLLDSLNNSYSEFFRDSLTIAAVKCIIMPALLAQKRNSKHKEIRIWSAACAAGQEAYSFAMLMDEIKNGGSEKFIYRIFATDHDESQVNKAIKGHYSETDLNNVSLTRVKQWFTKHGETYSIKAELKENINFTVFDLFSKEFRSPAESIFGDFDVVICSNLLFYYNNKYRQAILEKTGRSMARGGYLITGEAERQILLKNNYHEVFPQSGIFQKKWNN